jgi:g-D-glutamyl-meso-diaminopimelate peptidase
MKGGKSMMYGYDELTMDIRRLCAGHPQLTADVVGKSVMGKNLYVLRWGQGPKSLFANAAMHANEWITSPLLMRIVENMLESLNHGGEIGGWDAVQLFERVSFWFMPMVNPDGVELVQRGMQAAGDYHSSVLQANGGSADFRLWKANIHGVDLNDQFPAHWEIERDRRCVETPGPRDYPGAYPLSEPEAAAVAAFTNAHDFRMVFAFHTQGEEIYWNYRDYEPPRAERLAMSLAKASGYEAVKLSDSDAGFKDWFIQDWRRPGFTIEAGKGVNPLPMQQLPQMIKHNQEIIHTALLATLSANW